LFTGRPGNNLSVGRPPAGRAIIGYFTLYHVGISRNDGYKISLNPGFNRDNKGYAKHTEITEIAA